MTDTTPVVPAPPPPPAPSASWGPPGKRREPAAVIIFPSEVGNIYAKAGREKPVSGVTGFWNLIPLIGFIIWVVKVQGAMNRLYAEPRSVA